MSPSLNAFQSRQQRLAMAMQAAGLDAMALNPGPSLVYLTGLHFHLSERPVLVIFAPPAEPVIALPELEGVKVQELSYPLRPYFYGEEPGTWAGVFRQAAGALGLGQGSRVGLEPRRLRVLELRLLEAALPHCNLVAAEESIASLRMHKDAQEIAAMQTAVDIAQKALLATLPSIRMGMSEKDLAAELVLQLLRGGSDSEIPFQPIVSSGPNSANPHATPSERRLLAGDLLVIDWGAAWNGYFSDLTRTFAIGEVGAEWRRIAEIVEQANQAGQAACRPGAACGDVDAAARGVIEAAGYGQYFTHRTGHGLGMEGHEDPYMRAGNPLILAPGMTFTVEPGIYLAGRNGVRIEDNMAITPLGADCLSSLPRELIQVAG